MHRDRAANIAIPTCNDPILLAKLPAAAIIAADDFGLGRHFAFAPPLLVLRRKRLIQYDLRLTAIR
jgi:hypothetical protein